MRKVIIFLLLATYSCATNENKMIPYFEDYDAYHLDSILKKAPYLYNKIEYKNIPYKVYRVGEKETINGDTFHKIQDEIRREYGQYVKYIRLFRNDSIFLFRRYERYLQNEGGVLNIEQILKKETIKGKLNFTEVSKNKDTAYTKKYILYHNDFKHSVTIMPNKVEVISYPQKQKYFWKYFHFFMSNDTIDFLNYKKTKKQRKKEFKELIRSQ